MIRDACEADSARLEEMGEAFFAEAGWPARGVSFDVPSFGRLCGALSVRDIMIVAEFEGRVVGMMAAAFLPAWWNNAVLLCQEVFLYVEKEHRKKAGKGKMTGRRLLDEMEKRATANGATFCVMTAEHGLREDAVGRLYRAKGYAPADHNFWKRMAA